MKAVIQRVTRASVHLVDPLGAPSPPIAEIGPGLVTLLGLAAGDSEADVDRLIRKILALRIFEDAAGKMNHSLVDVGGQHLIVSQFTLLADTSRGHRPSFNDAARPEIALPFYEQALALSRELGVPTVGGRFRSAMRVAIENDGPVTIILETSQAGTLSC